MHGFSNPFRFNGWSGLFTITTASPPGADARGDLSSAMTGREYASKAPARTRATRIANCNFDLPMCPPNQTGISHVSLCRRTSPANASMIPQGTKVSEGVRYISPLTPFVFGIHQQPEPRQRPIPRGLDDSPRLSGLRTGSRPEMLTRCCIPSTSDTTSAPRSPAAWPPSPGSPPSASTSAGSPLSQVPVTCARPGNRWSPG